MADNSGRKQRAKYAKQRVKLMVKAFATMPKTDYLKMLGHDLQRFSIEILEKKRESLDKLVNLSR